MSRASPTTAGEPAVRLDAVTVSAAGRTLLDLDTLTIAAGERVAIVGPNGAGKSTLLRLIAGTVAPDRGQVRVLGREPRQLDRRQRRALRRDVAHLPQGLHLVARLDARDNVLIGALGRLAGRDAWRSWARWYPPALVDEADRALAALGLRERSQVRADRLSGGERQKVALARLRLQHAPLLLADEPTAALDPASTRLACDTLQAAADAVPGGTLVSVVHQRALLPALATRVLGLTRGRLAWDLPMAAVDDARFARLYDHERPDDPR